MKKIPFVKYTMHGNKFSLLDETLGPVLTESEKSGFAYRATNIYYGIGSDNFLVIQPCNSKILKKINDVHHYWGELPDPSSSDYIFRMFEPDGKEAFSCGNGLMCISNYLHRQYGVKSVRIMTEIPTSTPKVLTVGTDLEKKMNWANMGPPRKIPPGMANLPVTVSHDHGIEFVKNLKINYSNNGLSGSEKKTSLELSGYLVFTGEPHLVVFMDAGLTPKKLADHIFNSCCRKMSENENIKNDSSSRLVHQIGMFLNRNYSEYFPEGLNINFVRIPKGSEIIEYRCFERGINRETWACGTGAVAASFIARCLNMLTANEITVWPYISRLHDPSAHICVKEKEDDYILYGKPLLLFEGNFFV